MRKIMLVLHLKKTVKIKDLRPVKNIFILFFKLALYDLKIYYICSRFLKKKINDIVL